MDLLYVRRRRYVEKGKKKKSNSRHAQKWKFDIRFCRFYRKIFAFVEYNGRNGLEFAIWFEMSKM